MIFFFFDMIQSSVSSLWPSAPVHFVSIWVNIFCFFILINSKFAKIWERLEGNNQISGIHLRLDPRKC